MKYLRNLLLVAGVLGFAAVCAGADDAPAPPQSPEIWVPSSQLSVVLSKNPRAVLLTRDQYQGLMRDAAKPAGQAKEPPQRAVLSSARYTGELNGDVVDVHAEFTVNVLSDKWAEVPLRLGALALGDIKLDGDAALSAGDGAATLVVRGKGEHKITAEFMLPVKKDSGVSSLQLSLPQAGSGLFSFNLPPDTHVESSQPIDLKKNADSITVSVPIAAQNEVVVSWHGTGDSQQGAGILFQENSYIYSVDETRVQADLGIVLNAALGSLPASLQIKIPAGSTPLQVVGNEVLKWTANGDVLSVDLTPGDRKTVGIRVLLETPTQVGDGGTLLPMPDVAGVRRSAGKFAVIGSTGVKIKEIAAGEGPVQAEGIFDPSIEQDPHFSAGYGFAVQPAAVKISIEKVTPRFSADLDTLVQFKREAISIERTLALHGEEGEIFESNFVMPAGEELLSVRNGDGSEPDWKADGAAVKIRFSEGLGTGENRIFKITSRMEPAKWPDTDVVAVGDLKLAGAEKVNGYLALQAEQMFRLETTGAVGLEKRDGRTTPVKGDFAWFRREAFQLNVKISHREAEVQAVMLGYALPLDGALDVHGQVGFTILYSGVNKLRVKVPAGSADQFYFDGAQIAERNRDGDTWTIVLQKEITGWYPLKFHAVIPFDESKASFQVDIPDVQPLDVKQQLGTWAVEANTTTEISFQATGMNELDPLHAPALADYQPRHHVIGVYGYIGGKHSLGLSGVKHESAPMLTAVADRLDLDTVVSASGAERHKAVFSIRTVGDQFLDVTLPEGSTVWSLTLDGQPLKPVAEKPDVVRVQLPATLDRTRDTAVQLVYETRRHEWTGADDYKLAAPRLDTRIPVLQSHWQVWLPDGFCYTAFDSNLQKHADPDATPLLLAPFKWLKDKVLFRPSAAAVSMTKQDVGRLLAEAQSIHASGRFDLAYKRYDQVLSLDPGNAAAREGQAKVMSAKLQFANAAYDQTRAGLTFESAREWSTAPRKYINRTAAIPNGGVITNGGALMVNGGNLTIAATGATGANSTSYLSDKLDHIIIPEIEFRETSVRDALEFLRKKSVDLDTDESDPSRKGVNIVQKLELAGSGEVSATVSAPDTKITVSLKDIPLSEALRYVTSLGGLKYRVDPYAVVVVPLSENTDVLVTKEYDAPPGFFSNATLGGNGTISSLTVSGGAGQGVAVMRATPPAPTALAPPITAQDYLRNSGVQFPEGASAAYDPRTNKIVVRNTEENLDLADKTLMGATTLSKTGKNDVATLPGAGGLTPGVPGTVEGFGAVGSGTLVLGNGAAEGYTGGTTLSGTVTNSGATNSLFFDTTAGGRQSAGLLPMRLDLEHTGREYSFDGFYAAERVSFHYLNWWAEARWGWIWWVVGGLVFLAVPGFGVWRKLVWGSLTLTFFPVCLAPSLTGMCNALLIGWITGFVIYQIAARLLFRRVVVKEAAAV